jgi:hypothetical protein
VHLGAVHAQHARASSTAAKLCNARASAVPTLPHPPAWAMADDRAWAVAGAVWVGGWVGGGRGSSSKAQGEEW